MSEYKLVTISNREPQEWYYLYRQFVQSVNGFNAIGINYSDSHPWSGLATKPKWLYRAIKEGHIPEKKLIFTDSWDMIICAPPEEILKRHEALGGDISISAERNCFPETYRDDYDKLDSPTPYKYLNSGFIVGDTDAVLACLEAMDLGNVVDDYRMENGQNYHSNDQTLWQEIFLKQPVKIVLDRYQDLSQTLHDAKIEEFDFSEGRIRNVVTNSYPCSFHFNGGSKDKDELRTPILTHLNLL